MFEIDITKARVNLQSVIDDLKNSDTEIKRLNQEKADLQKTIERLEAEKAVLTQNNQKLNQENAKFQNEKKQDIENIKKFGDRITVLTQNNQQLNQEKTEVQKENNELRTYLNAAKEGIERLEAEKTTTERKNRLQNEDNLKRISKLEAENTDLKQEIQRSKNNIHINRGALKEENTIFPVKNEESKFKNRDANDPVIWMFNNWASNPRPLLPIGFDYVEGEFRIRNTQPLKSTGGVTKWIINKNGSIKYLFPNPNTFDEFTDINELYEMADMGRLQSKGKNKIKIEKPCEISETGFIEFRGKLRIL